MKLSMRWSWVPTWVLAHALAWPAPALAVAEGNAPAAAASAAAGRKVLKIAFSAGETSLDPARIVDLYSRTITPHIFEAMYTYDHLARPSRIKPLLATSLPEISADFKVWTIRIRPGIYFAGDPAFKGTRREVVAQDFIYQMKRVVDPANKSPVVSGLLDSKFIGLAGLREDALKNKKPFDYDKPIEGMQALDRHTLRLVLEEPRPRLLETLASSDLFPAVAREVVEFYGDKIDAHPVGTGPFRLKQWRRSSLIVLERSPDFREETYQAEPAPDDAAGQAILARFKGRRIPMLDEVQVAIIDENQPRWLSFLNTQLDALVGNVAPLPADFLHAAMPNGKLAPNLAKRGIIAIPNLNSDSGLSYFNMEDPVVGGLEPHKVALRRAISLAYDVEREIRLLRRGAAVVAQSPVVPNTTGYDPKFKSEMSDYDPPRAKALLDLYGYVDRDGDGWRELPDGKPFTLEIATQPEQRSRQFDELMRKNMDAIGIRTKFMVAKWPENLKAARAGKLMWWLLGSSAASPDGQGSLARMYGPQAGSQNLARFKLPEFDRVYERMQQLPDGPEREDLFRRAKLLTTAYMPYKTHVHRIETDIMHPWVLGFRRPVFWQDWWQFVDIDLARQAKGN